MSFTATRLVRSWLTLVVVLGALARAGLAAGPVELTVWAMGAEGKLLRTMADRFEAANPGVRVAVQSIPWTGAHEKLVTGVIGDMAPDVCQMGTTWMPEFRTMGALEPLGRFLAASRVKEGDFFPGALGSNRHGGEWYGLPWYVDTRVFFYRTDLAAAAGSPTFPDTWEGLRSLCRKIVENKRRKGETGPAFALPTKDWQFFLMFFWQCGGKILDPAAAEPISPGPGAEALRFMKSLFDEGLAPLEGGNDTDLPSAFESGSFPMFVSGPFMISILDRDKPALAGKWTTAPLAGKLHRTSFMGGCNLVMFRSSRNKEWAWRLIEFLELPENQAAWYELSRDLPASRAAWASPAIASNPHLKAFRAQLDDADSPPSVPEWEQIASQIDRVMERAVHGKTTPEEAMQTLADRVRGVAGQRGPGQSRSFKLLVLAAAALLALGFVFCWFRFSHGDLRVTSRYTQAGEAFVFLVPALTVLVVFLFVPILWSLVASLTDWDMYGIADPERVQFIGLDNYRKLASDPVFWTSLFNTLVFAVVGVPLNIFIALVMAVILNRGFVRFKALFRIGFFIPVITTMVAVAVIWRWLYNPEFGLLNLALSAVGIGPQNWLADERLALPCLIVMAVWKGFGYNMIIFIAALQAIPECLYESADIDGAGEWQKFVHVTIPMLKKTLFFVTVATSIGYLQFFAEPYVMTGGGPLNRTTSVVLYMYEHGFKFYNLGYASSIAYALFMLILGLSLAQMAIQKRMEGGAR